MKRSLHLSPARVEDICRLLLVRCALDGVSPERVVRDYVAEQEAFLAEREAEIRAGLLDGGDEFVEQLYAEDYAPLYKAAPQQPRRLAYAGNAT